VESAGSPDKPYNPADDEWKFLAREPVTQNQIDEVLSNVQQTKSWYAGMFEEIANKLEGLSSDEVTLSDARQSLEFVTAVYDSSNKEKIYFYLLRGKIHFTNLGSQKINKIFRFLEFDCLSYKDHIL
jgi:hypothetical protein